MKARYFILFISLLTATSSAVFAQEKLTLVDAISIALKKNYDIRLVNQAELIAQNNVNLGNAGLLPTVTGTFSTGGSRQNTVQTQSTGAQRITDGARSTNMAYGVGLDWTIFDGFAMFANYDRLKALQQQGQTNVQAQILTTIGDVVGAYYNIVKQQQLVVAADSAIDISNLRVRIANNKLEIGRGSKLDVLAATVDYNTDTSAYLQQQNLLATYKVTLNQLMGREASIPFYVENSLTIDNALSLSTLSNQAIQLNPTLQNAFLDKKIAELNLKVLKGARYPQISLNTGYDVNRSTSPTGFNTNFRANGLSYGVTASINIFNGFLQRQNERNAKININSAAITIDKVRQELNAQLVTAFQNYTTYLELVKLERKNVDIARQNLDITLEKYRLGSIAPLELREAQRNAIDANSRFLEIQYQAKLAEITLKELSGTLNIQ